MEEQNYNIEREIENSLSDNYDEEKVERINETQLYDVITSKKHDWQEIIYSLIDSERLDPWDIDIIMLTRKYFEKILELEEADFYVSGKVLHAAALLLRIKSEFLLEKHIRSLDEILFGKENDGKAGYEKIIIDESLIPELNPKTPLPRMKKVTLQELMSALSKAINTESRRIKREIAIKRARLLSEVDIPKFKRIDINERIRHFYARVLTFIKKENSKNSEKNSINYTDISGLDKEERIACFLPLLHLSNTKKIWLEQEKHLGEIIIYLYEYFEKNRDEFIKDLIDEAEEISEEFESKAENLDDVEIVGANKNIAKEIGNLKSSDNQI